MCVQGSKSQEAGSSWEARQLQRAEMRFKAAEYEKRMTREAARQRRKAGSSGLADKTEFLKAMEKGSNSLSKDVVQQTAGADFDWGMDMSEQHCTHFDVGDVPSGLQLATDVNIGAQLQVRSSDVLRRMPWQLCHRQCDDHH